MAKTIPTRPQESVVHSRPSITTERLSLVYRERTVIARKLTIQSRIPLPIERAWANVQTTALLRFVAAGIIRFKHLDGEWPATWMAGQTIRVKMRLFGYLPFGGIHYLYIDRIDDDTYEIATREWDWAARVWNHRISLRELGPQSIQYTDEIIIYAGVLTGLIVAFARYFYRHRQRRWQLIARKGLDFTIPQGD